MSEESKRKYSKISQQPGQAKIKVCAKERNRTGRLASAWYRAERQGELLLHLREVGGCCYALASRTRGLT